MEEYPAEIVPLDNPYERQVGDPLTVRCLVDGKPVKFIRMVPVSGESVNYESKWATLTFEVR